MSTPARKPRRLRTLKLQRDRQLPECPNCGGKLSNHGAESRGDGDIYDVLSCRECGPVYHAHADYCQCGCGGGILDNVTDPDWMPDFREDFGP